MDDSEQKAGEFLNSYAEEVRKATKFFSHFSLQGWMYVAHEETAFVEPSLEYVPPDQKPPPEPFEMVAAEKDAAGYLKTIAETEDPLALWTVLEELTTTYNDVLCRDDFQDADWRAALDAGPHNILVLGAGIVGLAFADLMKRHFGNAINIVMIETRAAALHIKKPYSRDWLTELPAELMTFCSPLLVDVQERLSAGKECYGVPINMLETILFLQCRDAGVKFLFAEEYDLDLVKGADLAFILDATGSNFKVHEHTGDAHKHDLQEEDPVQSGYMIFPRVNGERVKTAPIKITNIPVSFEEQLNAYTDKQEQGQEEVYVWRGELIPELNSMVAFINLDKTTYEALARGMPTAVPFKEFLDSKLYGALDASCGFKAFCAYLHGLGEEGSSIEVEPPYIFAPYLYNIGEVFPQIHDIPVIPIGDSIFNGSPKKGNGLRRHFHFLYALENASLARK